MRLPFAALVLVMLTSAASADEFGGWHFTVPQGYTASATAHAFAFQKVTPPTFCLMVLYPVRTKTQPLATEASAEWKTYVEGTLKASGVKHHGDGTTKSSLAFYATAGTIENEGSKLSAILYTVATGRSVSSVLLTSNSFDTITACRPSLSVLLDSLSLAPAQTPSPAPAPAAGEPAAPTSAIAGRWATSSASDSGSWGSVKRQYTFAADGTYRFYSEAWGGKYNSKLYRLISESGTYAISGDKVTIAPTKTSGVEKADAKTTAFKVTVEKMTYAWQRYYFEGIQEWNLVLTPSAKTARDGEFASNDQFPSSYMYSNKYAPEWTNPP